MQKQTVEVCGLMELKNVMQYCTAVQARPSPSIKRPRACAPIGGSPVVATFEALYHPFCYPTRPNELSLYAKENNPNIPSVKGISIIGQIPSFSTKIFFQYLSHTSDESSKYVMKHS